MTSRDRFQDDGPELVPPAEMLRLRHALMRAPDPEVRAQHLAAVTAASRQGVMGGPVGRFASRGVRVAAAVVASLAITSGLAGAQLLPQPAQRLLSNVSQRFAPSNDTPPPATTDEPDDSTSTTGSRPGRPEVDPGVGIASTLATDAPPDTSTATTAEPPVETTTTIAGPTGPGSPDDPADPDATTTTTIDPSSTTTTTDPSSTTTTTIDPTSTTTTTDPSSTTTTVATRVPPQ
jgi:hypothetical protein